MAPMAYELWATVPQPSPAALRAATWVASGYGTLAEARQSAQALLAAYRYPALVIYGGGRRRRIVALVTPKAEERGMDPERRGEAACVAGGGQGACVNTPHLASVQLSRVTAREPGSIVEP
jgi:hypothetical protein